MIAVGSDHVGLALKRELMIYLEKRHISYRDIGTFTEERCDYPKYALEACRAVIAGECDRGILICGTGAGMSIAANKADGIRCVCCSDPFTAKLSRQHNDTNMLALGSRVVGTELAEMIVDCWLEAEYEGGRHAARLRQIEEIEAVGAYYE